MPKQTRRPPRVRSKIVNGERHHVYRVIIERTLHRQFLVEAKSAYDAEQTAYDLAGKPPHDNLNLWKEEEMGIRDCTSVEMTDGSWEFCNALEEKKRCRESMN